MFAKNLWMMAEAAETALGDAVPAAETVAETAAETAVPYSPVFVACLGFATVFIGLLFLIAIITLMGKIVSKADKKAAAQKAAAAAAAPVQAAPAPVAAPAPAAAPVEEEFHEEDTDEFVAAVSACIATVMGNDVSAIRIASITRLN